MSLERGVAVALSLVSAVLLLRLAPNALRTIRIYAGTGRRRQQDATGQAPAMPLGIADRIALLAQVGYHRLGETRLALPVGERFAWIVAADDEESYAMLAGGMSGAPLTGIYSAWTDGTWLGTQHPLGTPADRPGLQIRIVPTTLADAARLHREGVERLRRIHGAPRRIGTMSDMLALDADYRERFGGTRLRPLTARIVMPAALSAAVLVLSLLALVVSR